MDTEKAEDMTELSRETCVRFPIRTEYETVPDWLEQILKEEGFYNFVFRKIDDKMYVFYVKDVKCFEVLADGTTTKSQLVLHSCYASNWLRYVGCDETIMRMWRRWAPLP